MPSSQAVGPILRFFGLAIELIGVSVLMLSGRRDGTDVASRFGIGTNGIWGIVVVGFALWAAGTVMIYLRRSPPARKDDAGLDRDLR